MRCYVMALAWGFVGLAVTYLSYNDRMVVLQDGAISVAGGASRIARGED